MVFCDGMSGVVSLFPWDDSGFGYHASAEKNGFGSGTAVGLPTLPTKMCVSWSRVISAVE